MWVVDISEGFGYGSASPENFSGADFRPYIVALLLALRESPEVRALWADHSGHRADSPPRKKNGLLQAWQLDALTMLLDGREYVECDG